jgi:hypothetical protein
MTTGRSCWMALTLVCVSGCAQSGPLLTQGSTVGSLKTSLTHLEFENQQLKREVATLKAENRDVEGRLVQEESANGELTARLDDARDLLRGRGVSNESNSEFDAPAKTLPAGQSSRKKRKPPFARIPGRIDPIPSLDDDIEPHSTRDPEADGPQSRLDRDNVWLPVVGGLLEPTPTRR